MAEAEKKANSKQLTADSEKKKQFTVNRKLSAKDKVKEVQDGTVKKSAAAKSKAKAAKEQVEEQNLVLGPQTAKKGIDSDNETVSSKIQVPRSSDEDKTAKAGKRSAKALKEKEELAAKEERKAARSAETADADRPKPAQKIRTAEDRLKTRGKNYRKANELIDKSKNYTLKEAAELSTKTSTVKFDATVELHIRLNVDPKQSDQNIRDTIVLPAGTGRSLRIAVFAEGDAIESAKKAGADIAQGEEFLQQLDKGKLDFDVLIAMPSTMPKLGKYARVLGPKGLMPNPKSGTVTNDVKKAVTEAKAGKVEYRVDSTGIIHVGAGKVSFGPDKILENVRALISSIKSNKPGSVKGTYFISAHLATTMGPSITIGTSEINSL